VSVEVPTGLEPVMEVLQTEKDDPPERRPASYLPVCLENQSPFALTTNDGKYEERARDRDSLGTAAHRWSAANVPAPAVPLCITARSA